MTNSEKRAKEEATRLASLRSLHILDTPPQECFDRITELCCSIFGCTIALVSLLDDKRQWFLSSKGLCVSETSRDISFCTHALESGNYLLVSDALNDDRFSENPLVTGGPGIRSYLGEPIAMRSGELIGTLCIADERPGLFDADDLRLLRLLARTVEDLVDAHAQRAAAAILATNLERKTDRLEKANRVFSQAEKTAKIGSWELEIESGNVLHSEQALAIHGYSGEEALTLDAALNRYVPEDRARIDAALASVIETRQPASVEADLIAFDGKRKRVKAMGEYLASTAERPARVVGILQDITEAYQTQLALQRAADHDALTGLLNRHAFDRTLAERVSDRSDGRGEFFVLLFDLDGFKDINDTFGHLVGDAVLEEVSSRIKMSVPQDAAVARWGGDEFVVISPVGTDVAQARAIGAEIISAITQEVEISGRKIGVTATCGLAACEDEVSGRELIRRADLALYRGKSWEPGSVHIYDADLERANRLRQDAIAKVRNALREDRLFAEYQPIVQLNTKSVIGFEALMRLHTRSGKHLTATEVLPAFLDPVLSRDISERMTDKLCEDFAEIRRAQGATQYISLNATEADLISRNYADRLLAALESSGIPAHRVTLEITETMLLVNDAAAVQSVLSDLRRSGMQIALDDFGTGFSSLSHLRDFPIDKVKIDGSFVQKMCNDAQSRHIVQALIGMAKNLSIEVIAEGIETEEQCNLLLSMGCFYGQGFLFSPAESASRLKFLQLGARRREQQAIESIEESRLNLVR